MPTRRSTSATHGSPTARHSTPTGNTAIEKRIVAVLFSDVKGYRLKEPQLKTFINVVLPRIMTVLSPYKDGMLEINTWGDAILLVTSDPNALAHFALDLRDFYRNTPWSDHQLPTDLNCRIGLHSGVVFIGDDPLRDRKGIIGTQMNVAARIEPITPVGEVFATDAFEKLSKQHTDDTIAFYDAGLQLLAKDFGTAHLYRLRRQHEAPPTAPPIETGHIETASQGITEPHSVLLQKSSEISDLNSTLSLRRWV
jgi:adenylate cyclase